MQRVPGTRKQAPQGAGRCDVPGVFVNDRPFWIPDS